MYAILYREDKTALSFSKASSVYGQLSLVPFDVHWFWLEFVWHLAKDALPFWSSWITLLLFLFQCS